MFIHLGGNYIIPIKEVIAVVDIKSGYLKEVHPESGVKKEMRIIKVSKSKAKSCVITDEVIYLSPISPLSLKDRLMSGEITK